MFQGMFESSTIPILEQVVGFCQARHTVLAGNIANMDTPGYRVRDLSVEDFRERLQEALQSRDTTRPRSPGEVGMESPPRLAEVAESSSSILYHDDSDVSLEHQVSEMVKNQMEHNLALSIMTNQMQLLQAAIAERA